MAKSATALINAELLVWARKSSAMDVNEAARKLRVPEEKLESWEKGSSQPTVKQVRRLANIYRQSFATFYLPEPPEVFKAPVRDYRRIHAEHYGSVSRELAVDLRLAMDRREIYLELSRARGDSPAEFAARATMRKNPETLGEESRELLGVTFDKQRTWSEPREAFNHWRQAVEGVGVLVFQTSRVPLSYMRGYSVTQLPLPVIVVNRKDTPNGRIFTMIKGKGGPTPPVNAVSIAGKPFARMVLDAFYSERLTSSEVSDYLGIKLNHLEKVEEMVGV